MRIARSAPTIGASAPTIAAFAARLGASKRVEIFAAAQIGAPAQATQHPGRGMPPEPLDIADRTLGHRAVVVDRPLEASELGGVGHAQDPGRRVGERAVTRGVQVHAIGGPHRGFDEAGTRAHVEEPHARKDDPAG